MDEMIEETLEDAHKRMNGAVGVFKQDIAGVRTNRAAPAMVENITVDYHGSPMPMNQVAQISAGDARLLVHRPSPSAWIIRCRSSSSTCSFRRTC